MELIRINSHKLKIMLTPADMSHFELPTEGFAESGDRSRRSVSLLLKELRERFGFEADEEGLSVQFFPSREGGCEMFISKPLEEKAEERVRKMLDIPKNQIPLNVIFIGQPIKEEPARDQYNEKYIHRVE